MSGCEDWAGKVDDAAIGDRILAFDGPHVIRVVNKGAKPGEPAKVHYVGRHADVAGLLRDTEHLELGLYDEGLHNALNGVRFILTDDNEQRRQQVAILRAAQRHVASVIGSDGEPPNDDAYLAWVRKQTEAQAHVVLCAIDASRGVGRDWNVVREYAYFVPYLCSARLFGVAAPDTMPWLIRLMLLGRNIVSPARWLRVKGDLSAGTTMLFWSQLILGQVFGNLGSHSGMLLKVARIAAKQWSERLQSAITAPGVPDDSLLAGFRAVRGRFPELSDATYQAHVHSTLFELIGTLTLLVGTGFSNILHWTTQADAAARGLAWPQLSKALRDPASAPTVINELLRLAPVTGQLPRRVRAPLTIGDTDLAAGDWLILLVGAACRDPRVFASPADFTPDPARDYLNFGAVGGVHPCYGQNIARTILAAMVPQLSAAAAPLPDNDPSHALTTFAGLPDAMSWALYRCPEIPGRSAQELLL
jgi:hypothetical protein